MRAGRAPALPALGLALSLASGLAGDTPVARAGDEDNAARATCYERLGEKLKLPEVPGLGYAWQKKTRAEAESAALADAQTDFEARYCRGDGPPDLNCRVVRAHGGLLPIGDAWEEKRGLTRTWSACATWGVEARRLRDIRAELDAIPGRVRDFAGRVAARAVELRRGAAGKPVVALEGFYWGGSSCAASDLGPALAGPVRDALSAQAGISLSGDGVWREEAVPLRVRLYPGADALRVVGELSPAAACDEVTVEGFPIAADLLDVDPGARGDCAGDGLLKLAGGRRLGADCLRVAVDVSTRPGSVLCEGDRIEPRIRTNRPARVTLFSVMKDGRAWRIWPGRTGGAAVANTTLVDPMEMVRLPDVGDEMLVAVATPEGAHPDPVLDRWDGYCRVNQVFGPALYPQGAAVGVATFTVLPPDALGCGNLPGDAAGAWAHLNEAPECR